MVPIREYLCEQCGKGFEFLAMNSHDKAECPKCHSSKLTRKLSVFAAGKSSESGSMDMGHCGEGACGSDACGDGACASMMN